jgi:hypothetical protein
MVLMKNFNEEMVLSQRRRNEGRVSTEHLGVRTTHLYV